MTNTLTSPEQDMSRINDRVVKLTWRVPSLDSEEGEAYTRLSVQHSNKRLLATLRVLHVESDGPFRVEKYMLFDGQTVTHQPLPRYSRKALEDFTTTALHVVRDAWLEGNASVQKMLPPEDVTA